MSNVTDLPTSARRGRVRRAGRLVPDDDQHRIDRAAAADGGQRAEPGLAGVDDLGAEPRKRCGAFRQAGRGDDVRRRVDQLAGDVGPAADEGRAVRNESEVVAGAADHEPLDAARKVSAAPAATVVAADDGAFGQRAHLLLDGDGQRRIERPGDRPAGAARAHRARGCSPQTFGVGRERHDGQRALGRVHHRDGIGIRQRALRSAQLHRPLPAAAAIRSAPTACGSPPVTSTPSSSNALIGKLSFT